MFGLRRWLKNKENTLKNSFFKELKFYPKDWQKYLKIDGTTTYTELLPLVLPEFKERY